MYQKEIIYMGLHKDGSRIGSAGFLKAEKRDKTGVLTAVVKNIPHSIEGRFPVRYCLGETGGEPAVEGGGTAAAEQTERKGWKEEDGITLHDGGGVWEKRELEVPEQIQVQILLPNGYLVEGASKAVVRRTPQKNETSAEPESAWARQGAPAKPESASVRQGASAEFEPAPMQRSASVESEPVSVRASARAEPEPVSVRPSAFAESEPVSVRPSASAESEPVSVRASAPAEPESAWARPGASAESESLPSVVPLRPPLMADALAIEGLKEDKWEQILDTYDRIHPYGDDRVYVKIAPKDFIILASSCQHLVNNSFLLHGFYNYRYVILGKGENSLRELSLGGYSASSPEKEEYCLGVPGVFYEREKMVAQMFGFEAFECEGGDPKPGDFGYYLRKVEL